MSLPRTETEQLSKMSTQVLSILITVIGNIDRKVLCFHEPWNVLTRDPSKQASTSEKVPKPSYKSNSLIRVACVCHPFFQIQILEAGGNLMKPSEMECRGTKQMSSKQLQLPIHKHNLNLLWEREESLEWEEGFPFGCKFVRFHCRPFKT